MDKLQIQLGEAGNNIVDDAGKMFEVLSPIGFFSHFSIGTIRAATAAAVNILASVFEVYFLVKVKVEQQHTLIHAIDASTYSGVEVSADSKKKKK